MTTDYTYLIGLKVTKTSNKPFKSRLKINTVKEIVWCDRLKKWMSSFEEDDSLVECWKLVVKQ